MAHLLRCYAQINPQRIKDTPAVNLCSRLVSVPSIFKSAGYAGAAWMSLFGNVHPYTFPNGEFAFANIAFT